MGWMTITNIKTGDTEFPGDDVDYQKYPRDMEIAQQIEESKKIHRRADELVARDHARAYAAAPTYFFCGRKVMPEHAAMGRPNEHRSCTEETFYHETNEEE